MKKVCKFPDCTKWGIGGGHRGYCQRHFRQLNDGDEESSSDDGELSSDDDNGKQPSRSPGSYCKYPGCNNHRQTKCQGYCRRHFMQCIASDDESSYDESSSDDDSDNTAPSSAKSRCNHPGCTKNKQHNCFGYCQAHVKLYNDPIAAAALHALSSSEEEEEDDEPSPNAYAGVSWDKVAKKYKSRISIPQNMRMAHKNKRVVYLGSYALAADAALAHDEGARLLKLPSKANFATIKDYEKAKRAVGGTNDGMSSAEILSKVKDVVSKIQPKSNIGDEELSDDDGSDEEMSVASDRSGPSAAIKREERIAPDVTFAKSRSNKGGTNEHSRRIFLKPLFEVGDAVQACWWPDEKSRRANSASAWYPGTVRSYKEKKTNSPYGPTRIYDIHYDDDDELDGVEEQYVWSREDYTMNEKNWDYMSKKRNKGKSSWIGVKNATDKKSTDSWAKIVGWYVATIDGQEQKFAHISGNVLWVVLIAMVQLECSLNSFVFVSFSQMQWTLTIITLLSSRGRERKSPSSTAQSSGDGCLKTPTTLMGALVQMLELTQEYRPLPQNCPRASVRR
mgnify:CR=1 FL=1